eukprot:2266465-Amphidinium_carterae.2
MESQYLSNRVWSDSALVLPCFPLEECWEPALCTVEAVRARGCAPKRGRHRKREAQLCAPLECEFTCGALQKKALEPCAQALLRSSPMPVLQISSVTKAVDILCRVKMSCVFAYCMCTQTLFQPVFNMFRVKVRPGSDSRASMWTLKLPVYFLKNS